MKASLILIVMTAVAAAGCGLEQPGIPALSGPSGLAQAFALTAFPQQLPRDGASQSTVTLTATDVSGAPLAGQRFRLTVTPSEAAPSVTEVTTDANGRATFTVKAPPITSGAADISITATAIGGFSDAASRFLTVSLSGAPNTGDPVPSFTVTPATPEIRQLVTFDASGSTDEGVVCATGCTFTWNFGDGGTATGPIVQRSYANPGIYQVSLTMTDPAGRSVTTAQSLAVADIDAPTVATPTVSPATPFVDQPAVFTAVATADPDGHRIVRYDWSFGDGTSASTTQGNVTKTYTVPGQYLVRVTVTDDAGRTRDAVATVNVVSQTPNAPVARFTVSPEQPTAGNAATFDARSSTAGTRGVIVTYAWNFGDGTPVVTSTQPTIQKTFAAAGTYAVRLTVTDNTGQTNTVGRQVVVNAP